MNKRRLIQQSLRHYWRTHLGVIAGAAVGAAVLSGALVVGDSVRHTLREQALARIGQIDIALTANDRLFQASLADRIAASFEGSRITALLQARGVASTFDGSRLAREVSVLGVDSSFFDLAPHSEKMTLSDTNEVFLNERLAGQLQVAPGDEIIIRVEKPSALPRESVLATVEDISLALRVRIIGLVDEDSFGRFSLLADQIPPNNVYFSIDWLQRQLDVSGRANVLLVDVDDFDDPEAQIAAADVAVRDVFAYRDAQLGIEPVIGSDEDELSSDRIFIEPLVEDTIAGSDEPRKGFLTYFVNSIDFDDRSTPYSMVTALGSLHEDQRITFGPSIPGDLADDEIVINEWLADDLQCAPGDTIQLRYFILDEMDQLLESASVFTVRAITPIEGLAADRSLMPDFPGIADAESSRDWQPGIPIDLGLIRDKDEAYWDAFRGTPKAFVTLAAGKAMWGNRYGALTAIRFPQDMTPAIRETLQRDIDPASLGFFFQDVRTPALLASKSTTDFGGLFLALSFFLIFAALLLTALLFVFNIEQRAREIGTLLAIGYQPRQVSRLLIGEGAGLAMVGSVIGTVAGVAYTRAILSALAGVWSEAIASASIELFVSPLTLLIGAVASITAAVGAMWFTLGRIVRRSPVTLLAGDLTDHDFTGKTKRSRISTILAVASILSAIVIALAVDTDSRSASMAFFGAGSLLLVGGIALSRVGLLRLRLAATNLRTSFRSMAIRNSSRRIGRSLTTIFLLASGVFLVVAVAANRLDSSRDAEDRSAGTGGFAFIGESTIPVHANLNRTRGRDVFGLTEQDLEGVSFVSMRVRDGDDASCLNLNLAQNPRLMGVDPEALDSRSAFSFARFLDYLGPEPGWRMLEAALDDGAIPAIADDKSVTWAMHKTIGDTIDFTDEQGKPFKVMIVGTIANSILQGNLLIDADRFRNLFPSEQGFRAFLIDAPRPNRPELAQRLQRAMSDVGFEVTSTADRLDDFNAVQNTYLSIFQLLGGLGLLLGSIGLGIVVVRNVLERRTELALLRALGFNLKAIRRYVRDEHVFVLFLGLLWGMVAALVAVIPALRSATAEFPVRFTIIILGALILNGGFWVWLATRLAVSGSLVDSMREE